MSLLIRDLGRLELETFDEKVAVHLIYEISKKFHFHISLILSKRIYLQHTVWKLKNFPNILRILCEINFGKF